MIVIFLVFSETSTVAVPIYIHSHQQYERVLFSPHPSLPIFVICVLSDKSYSDRFEVIPHCEFDLHFPDN